LYGYLSGEDLKMQLGFFDIEKRHQQLNKLKDPLLELSSLIDFEMFREEIEKCFQKERKDNSGRKPFDKVMLFKCLILKRLYALSNEELEFQITDRSSFRRFLKINENGFSPDEKTFWLFNDDLAKKEAIDELFIKFDEFLNRQGYMAKRGSMIDASFVEVPKQRNTRDENKEIKEGKIPESFTQNVHKLAQKDTDARWTKKGGNSYYGYKNHINADVKYKLVRKYEITSAEVHDSRPFEGLLDEKNDTKKLWADSAYMSEAIIPLLLGKMIEAKINERAYRNKPLTEEQKVQNRNLSKTRARVEHIFGFMKNSLKADMIRTVGIVRAKSEIAMINLTYNLCRYCQLKRGRCVSVG
jgi:IS5 family transposase